MIDTHIHTKYSFDAEKAPEVYIENAISKGLTVITFTEHLDVDEYYGENHKMRYLMEDYKRDFPSIKDAYKDKIKILYGVELGNPQINWSFTEEVLEKYNFDYILGSVHCVREHRDFYHTEFDKEDPHRLLLQYFSEVQEVLEKKICNCLAHLTYPVRYINKYYKNLSLLKYYHLIDEIFNTLIETNTALEINTGGLRKDYYKKTDPNRELIERYYNQGGRLITFGSDAHKPEFLYADIPETARMCEEIGFKDTVYYENKKPNLIPISKIK